MMKKILILSVLTFPLFGDIKQRLEKLEKEMGEVRIETPMANFGAAYAPGQPSLREGQKSWYATGEILYWNAKVGGTEYALSSGGQSTLPFAPTRGRVKGNSFGWKYGGRVGIGKVLMHEKWDAYLYPKKLKTWSFAKVSALDLIPSKQLLFKWIGAMEMGSKMGMLTQGKTKF